ncbi:MAG: hypothetical protein M0Q95_10285 [Porticoccaceae bacterium]|nr:hypothetical protein [Porticoccaceae bacterium]
MISDSATSPIMAMAIKIRSPTTTPTAVAMPLRTFTVAERTTTSATLALGIAANALMTSKSPRVSYAIIPFSH